MKRLVLAAVTLASMTSVASAGTYIGLGVGSESSGSAVRSDGVDAGSMDGFGRSGRFILGMRLSRLSVEGQLGRYDVVLGAAAYEATQAALALKLSVPLGSNFEFFGRGGLGRTWLGGSEMRDASGNGYLLGAGFEYRLNLGVTGASIFVDYQRTATDFTNHQMTEFSGTSSMWTLGATVSL